MNKCQRCLKKTRNKLICKDCAALWRKLDRKKMGETAKLITFFEDKDEHFEFFKSRKR